VLDLGSGLWLLTHEDLRRVARVEAVIATLGAALTAGRQAFEGSPLTEVGRRP
jgi:hypothetical protein